MALFVDEKEAECFPYEVVLSIKKENEKHMHRLLMTTKMKMVDIHS